MCWLPWATNPPRHSPPCTATAAACASCTPVTCSSAPADGVDCACIADVAVHPEHQGRGLGSGIIRRLVELAAAGGLKPARDTAPRAGCPPPVRAPPCGPGTC
ncbi:GNAT family N-acetyltransferase [Streptomyces sp. KO7888]|uniref:GNAT family N-acetyltransferase n=1 Tax=Streptomyces sp. KO7888 TaxID=2602737 RepID=UPI0013F69D64